MKVLQWLSWIVVIVIGAMLPWLVNDWIHQEKTPFFLKGGSVSEGIEPGEESLSEEDVVAVEPAPLEPEPEPEPEPGRSTSEKVSNFFRQAWLSVRRPSEVDPPGRLDSERSQAVAARIGPVLEAALVEKKLKLGLPVFIRIFKEPNELEVWMEPEPGAEWVLFKIYPICKWSGELGPKQKEGDGQAPEGFYFVPIRRMNPESDFHLSFDLGFPNDYDRSRGRTGTHLMVHGNCVSIGCYAMTDPGIEEIYTLASEALRNGQPFFRVHAFPFRMSDEKMESLSESAKWFEFWANLKEGYDYFEIVKKPPDVKLTEGRYEFQ